MAQAGFTPISLYFSSTAAAVPSSGNLANGELALNIADMKLYAKNSAGVVTLLASNASTTGVDSLSFGSTGLTPSTATTGAITVAGTLNVANGGTGLTSLTAGRIPYGAGTSAFGNSASLFWDSANSRLGVGTASPVGRFQVAGGTATFSSGGSGGVFGDDNTSYFLLQGSSTASSAAIYLNGAGRTSFGGHLQYAGAQHTWYNAAVNTAWMVLDGSGNLGVGTTAPQGKLHSVATATLGTFSSYNLWLSTVGGATTDGLGFGDTGSNAYKFIQSYGAILSINPSGNNVAIGQTTAPQKLTVAGAMAATSNSGTANTNYATFGLYTGGAIPITYIQMPVGGATDFWRPDTGTIFRMGTAGQFGVGTNYGTAGQVLTSGGASAAPTWSTAGGGTTILFAAFSSLMGM